MVGGASFYLFILISTRWMGPLLFFLFFHTRMKKKKTDPIPKYINIYTMQLTRFPFFVFFSSYIHNMLTGTPTWQWRENVKVLTREGDEGEGEGEGGVGRGEIES